MRLLLRFGNRKDRNSERDCFIPLRFIRNDDFCLVVVERSVFIGMAYPDLSGLVQA